MTYTPKELSEAIEVLQDHLERKQFWHRGKNRNDVIQTALTILQALQNGELVARDEKYMTREEVEKIVNEKIAEALPVVRTDMRLKDAEALEAEHEFGATYPDTVSVYSVGPLDSAFSIEFCGGPHAANTGELGVGGRKFKVLKEEASAAGIRRIKAVLE